MRGYDAWKTREPDHDFEYDCRRDDELIERDCSHDLVEVKSINGRNLEGAVRQCAQCFAVLARSAK